MHILFNRGTADRLPLPLAPYQMPAKLDPAIREPMPAGLSREELRRIVIELIG